MAVTSSGAYWSSPPSPFSAIITAFVKLCYTVLRCIATLDIAPRIAANKQCRYIGDFRIQLKCDGTR